MHCYFENKDVFNQLALKTIEANLKADDICIWNLYTPMVH